MKERKHTGKRIFAFLMALALIMTSFTVPTENVFAAKTSQAVKSVSLKIGKTNVTKKTITLFYGEKEKLSVAVSPSAAKKAVSIKSSKSSIVSVDKKGNLTAKKAGKAKISVKVTGKNKKTKTTYVNINVKKAFSLNKASLSLQKGYTTAVKTNAAAYNKVTWKTSDKSVATVTNGKIYAVAPGTAKITATIGKVSDTVKVTVLETTKLVVAKTLALKVGETKQLFPKLEPETVKNETYEWKSYRPDIAVVDKNGNVTGKAAGTARIRVNGKNSGAFANIEVTVTADGTVDNGMSMTVTNQIDKYSDDKRAVVMMGDEAEIKVRLVKNGVGIAKKDITLAMKKVSGNADVYKVDDTTIRTDEDGYAKFKVVAKNADQTPGVLDGKNVGYRLTAKYVDSDSRGEQDPVSISLCFADVEYDTAAGVNDLFVQNQYDEDLPKLETSENASAADSGIATTKSMGGDYNVEYVTSQQVTSKKKPHAITMRVVPQLVIPEAASEEVGNKYYELINETSGNYSVYNDETNESTTKVIETIPAGLLYARIYFDNITISKYTKLQIKFYDKKTNEQIGKTQEINADSFGEDSKIVQVPVKDDREVKAVIALISAGQVDEGLNDGYTVAKVEGEWKSEGSQQMDRIDLDEAVTWSTDDGFGRSTAINLSYEQAQEYLPAGSKFLSVNNSYSCRVPAFPSVGNAVIDVKDANGKNVATFMYPSENEKLQDVYQNSNAIKASSTTLKAVNSSAEEIENKVGEIITNTGSTITVDSTKAGYTPLKATVDLNKALGVKLNAFNLYTSIQWSPVTNDDEKPEAEDFYAVKGQQVEVVAQLYDSNDNKVAQEGKQVTFYQGEKLLKSFGFDGKNPSTDKNGQCKITLRNPSQTELFLEELNAKAESFKVRLSIGNQEEVALANIHWVDLGLYYCNDVLDDIEKSSKQGEYLVTDHTIHSGVVETRVFSGNKVLGKYKYNNVQEPGTATATGAKINLSRSVGSQWIFGMPVVGCLNDGTEDIVKKVSGVTVHYSKSGVGDRQVGEVDTESGIYTMTSSVKGDSVLTGKVDAQSISQGTPVYFTIYDAKDKRDYTYPNVGTGTAGISASISLAVNWDPSGMVLKAISPLGDQLDVTTATKVYFSLKDSFGNALATQTVSYKITSTELPALAKEGTVTTDSKGLASISLAAPQQAGTIMITCSCDGDNATDTKTINYVSSGMTTPFSAVSATLAKETEPYTITVNFSSALRSTSVKKEMFKIYKKGSATKDDYRIQSASVVPGHEDQVVLVLDGTGLKDVNVSDVLLDIQPFTDEDGIEYQIVDTNYRTLSNGKGLTIK
ncbi:MAG: Ig-like domain-containing protein [Lachnospiraceae bacterium]